MSILNFILWLLLAFITIVILKAISEIFKPELKRFYNFLKKTHVQ